MSEDFLNIIPTDPEYVPDQSSQEQALALLQGLLPPPHYSDTAIQAITTKWVEFIDQGGNFERIVCPFCSTELSTEWWGEAMNMAFETHFANLSITTPCCHSNSSLNDLVYEWPAGFARFVLEIREPYYLDEEGVVQPLHLTNAQDQALRAILKCDLRTIWAHY